MKNYNVLSKIGIAIIFTLFTITSCDKNDVLKDTDRQLQNCIRASLNVSKTEFDTPETSGTRAVSYDWNNGDVLHLRLHTDNGVVIGNATYNAEDKDWMITYEGELNENSDTKVEITYLESTQPEKEHTINLTANDAIYQDKGGTYFYSSLDSIITIKANLEPITSRIRFKGDIGREISFKGLKHCVSYNTENGTTSFSYEPVNETVMEDGYTRYIYGILAATENPQIKIRETNKNGEVYIFTADCPEGILKIGKSGWMNIPTMVSHNGWKEARQVRGFENGHEWIDLGLPSGTRWATKNIGADTDSVMGKTFFFGETYNYEYYDGEGDIQGSPYDTAKDKWGGEWVMPSNSDFQELLDYYDHDFDNNGLIISGPSEEELRIPYNHVANFYNQSYYWTSTTIPNNTTLRAYAVSAYADGNESELKLIGTAVRNGDKNYIRPVIKQ